MGFKFTRILRDAFKRLSLLIDVVVRHVLQCRAELYIAGGLAPDIDGS